MGRFRMEAGAQGGGRAMAQMTAGKTLGMQQEERTVCPAAGPSPAGPREERAGEAEPAGGFPAARDLVKLGVWGHLHTPAPRPWPPPCIPHPASPSSRPRGPPGVSPVSCPGCPA